MFSLNDIFGDTKAIAAASGHPEASEFVGPRLPKKAAKKAGLWENIFGAASTFARSAGVAMPMDTEIAALESKKKALAGLQYQMDSILRLAVPRLESRRTAAAASYAASLKKTASQAKAQATAAIRLINAALADGRLAQEKMKYGTGLIRPSATFFTKKAIADQTFSLAKNRLELVRSSWESIERRLMADTPLPSQIGEAARSTVVEFGGKVSRGVVRFGHITEDAAESVAKGAESLAPYAKYAPYVLAGFAGLYALQFLPKARRD